MQFKSGLPMAEIALFPILQGQLFCSFLPVNKMRYYNIQIRQRSPLNWIFAFHNIIKRRESSRFEFIYEDYLNFFDEIVVGENLFNLWIENFIPNIVLLKSRKFKFFMHMGGKRLVYKKKNCGLEIYPE